MNEQITEEKKNVLNLVGPSEVDSYNESHLKYCINNTVQYTEAIKCQKLLRKSIFQVKIKCFFLQISV